MQRNPIVQIRTERNLSTAEFALALGVSRNSVYNHEAGAVRKPHPQFLEGLQALGYDPDVIKRDYLAWREEQRQEYLRHK